MLITETFGNVDRNKKGARKLVMNYVATDLIQLGWNFEESLGNADCGQNLSEAVEVLQLCVTQVY